MFSFFHDRSSDPDSHHSRRRLRLERLESRNLLAGNAADDCAERIAALAARIGGELGERLSAIAERLGAISAQASASNAAARASLAGRVGVLGTPGTGTPQLSVRDVEVREGNTGTVDAVFRVTLSPAATTDVTVQFATVAGSASEGTDFIGDTGVLTFTPGQTSQLVSVSVNGDLLSEGNERFFLQLSAANGAIIGDSEARATILDNELVDDDDDDDGDDDDLPGGGDDDDDDDDDDGDGDDDDDDDDDDDLPGGGDDDDDDNDDDDDRRNNRGNDDDDDDDRRNRRGGDDDDDNRRNTRRNNRNDN